ncbi:uncharacterized protein BDR25DRAFT_368996 [Lindgomyces ingoldianus]|uniref:Uncharacterized protein n=1 Tax=Lindgomyces ingoldianus TaxID=673940 RepID=A0ACB6QVI4_9PLEO|nr:uncharacterized protein BDR25DRAFT_368996 [Lindgomyces ingoldianus]KAF2470588.1 hypothetical protein BDR25DRAFT_368996 [Lindgomyces ingoldianus]
MNCRVPRVIRQCCQDMLQQQWARQLPIIQAQSPARVATVGLESAVNEVAARDGARLVVIDFAAGGGGPTPISERLINAERKANGDAPLEFLMCDLYPNFPAWNELCKKSDNLGFIPESVDAASPPPRALSVNTKRRISWTDQQPEGKSDTRIFRLFNLSFHHFDDETAKNILHSTLRSAEGIAIIELQDRRIGCLAMMVFNFFLSLLMTCSWFPPFCPNRQQRRQNRIQNLLTYTFILPFILCWDGVASCLRTREFEEVMELIGEHCDIAGWTFSWRRQMHTAPFGYVSWITGVKKQRRLDSMQDSRKSSMKVTSALSGSGSGSGSASMTGESSLSGSSSRFVSAPPSAFGFADAM